MLNSFLNRYKEKLVVDRIVLTEGNSIQLITDPEEILRKCHLQYDTLKKKRQHGFDNLDQAWKSTYELILTIPEYTYTDLLKEPALNEWEATVRSMNKHSAPGSS